MRSYGKKKWMVVPAAGLMLLLCASCGGGTAAESPLFSTPEPAVTEEPAVTASPAPTETPEPPKPEAEAVSAIRLSGADSESAPAEQAAGGTSSVNTTVNSGASAAAVRQEESHAEETPEPDIITGSEYQVEICYGEPTEPPSEVDILAPNQPDYEVGPPN